MARSEPKTGSHEYMRKSSHYALRQDYIGATGAEWMALSFVADEAGMPDMVTVCREMAAKAYAREDGQVIEQKEEIDCAALLVSE